MTIRDAGLRFLTSVALGSHLLTMALQPGCERGKPAGDRDPVCPTCPPLDFTTGLYGSVTGGGRPVILDLAADNREDWLSGASLEHVVVGTKTDTAGFFALPVPPGRYELKYRCTAEYPERIGYIAEDKSLHLVPNTIAVPDSGPVRFDVALNELRVTIRNAWYWEEEPLRLAIEPRAPLMRGPSVVEGDSTILRLFGLPEDQYRLSLSDSYGVLWLPPTYDRHSAEPVPISGGGIEEFECAIPSPGRFAGYLRGGWLAMHLPPPSIVGVYVRVWSADSVEVLQALADRDTGWFSLPIFAPLSNARLQIAFGYYEPWYGGPTFTEARQVDLDAGRETMLDFVDRGLEVRVPGRQDFALTLMDSTFAEVGVFYSGWPGEYDSYYSDILPIPFLEVGTYYLYFHECRTRWPAHWYRAALTREDATPVVLGGDSLVVHVLVDSVPPF